MANVKRAMLITPSNIFIIFNGFLKCVKIMLVRSGEISTSELIFTPKARPKNIADKKIAYVFLVFTNKRMSSKQQNRKKVSVDSGVEKCACWISPGVSATRVVGKRENLSLKKKRLM